MKESSKIWKRKTIDCLFDWHDWIPGVGIYHLIQKRIPNMPYEKMNSLKTGFYVWSNGMFNYAVGYGLYQLYLGLKR